MDSSSMTSAASGNGLHDRASRALGSIVESLKNDATIPIFRAEGLEIFLSQLKEAHEADVSRRSRSQATSLLIRAVTLCTASYSVKYIEDPMFRIILSGTISAACVPLIRSAWATFQSLKRQLQISGSQAHDVPDQSQGDEEFARSLRAKTIEAVEQAKHHLSISQESPEDGSKTVLTVPEDYVKSIEALATDLRDYLSREVACVSQSSAE